MAVGLNRAQLGNEYHLILGMTMTIIILMFLFFVSIYILSVFCAALCGRAYEAGAYPALICGIIPAIIALIGFMVFNGVWQINIMSQLTTILRGSSPFGFLIGGLDEVLGFYRFPQFRGSGNVAEFIGNHAIFLKPAVIIPFILVNAGFLTSAYYLGKKRKAESTGKAFVSNIASEIIISLVMFTITALFCYGMFQVREAQGGFFFGMFISTAVAFLFLDVTIKRGFKRMGRAFFRYVLMVGGSVLVSMLLLSANGFGIGEYVPPLNDIKSVSFDMRYVSGDYNSFWYENYNGQTVFTDSDNIKFLRELHVESNNNPPARMNYGGEWFYSHYDTYYGFVTFTYTLKNGRQVKRNVVMDNAEREELLALYVSEEYKEMFVSSLEEMYKKSNSLAINIDSVISGMTLFSSTTNIFADTDALFEALKKDISAETFEQRYLSTGKNIGVMSLSFVEPVKHPQSGYYEKNFYLGNATVVIRPHFTNVIAELERQKIELSEDYSETFKENYMHNEKFPEFSLLKYNVVARPPLHRRWDVPSIEVYYNSETAELFELLFDVAQPTYLINGQGFVLYTWWNSNGLSNLVIPPEYVYLVEQLWKIGEMQSVNDSSDYGDEHYAIPEKIYAYD